MALIHRATLVPSKLDAIAAWIPAQPWWSGENGIGLEAVGAYRYDDPAGEVGVETHLLRAASGTIFQVPLTYRAAPLNVAEAYLVATIDHSALGKRWVYDGVGDPVYVAVTAAAIANGATRAELLVQESDGSRTEREQSTSVSGTGANPVAGPIGAVTIEQAGSATHVRAKDFTLVVRRVIDATATELPHLFGTWPGQSEPVALVELRD
ncbi:MAG: CG0192-related protein [Rhodococcus sp. (in: high G+C Gram-positive bacteria)]